MNKEKQIEEMAQIIRNRLPHIGKACVEGECIKGDKNSVYETPCWCVYKEIAEMLYNAGYRKQSAGEWVNSDIPQEKYVCSACGGACWYYDFKGDVAKSRFCPNCGARMKGGAE